jgi:hypothetical protein
MFIYKSTFYGKYDLEDWLVDFACSMIDVVKTLLNAGEGNYVADRLIKSCHSPTSTYDGVKGA